MFKRMICVGKSRIGNIIIFKYLMTYLAVISHRIHILYTYTARKMQYICTCFCTASCDMLNMEKQMSCAIWYRTSVFAH